MKIVCSFALATIVVSLTHPPLIVPEMGMNTSAYTLIARDASGSALWRISSTKEWQLGAPYLLDLHGSRVAQGQAYASLVGPLATANFPGFFALIMPNASQRDLVLQFADWQWASFMSAHVPAEYLDELRGVGNVSAPLLTSMTRLLVLAVGPADGDNWQAMIDAELASGAPCPFSAAQLAEIVETLSHLGGAAKFQCDMFAAWGNRTVRGDFIGSRNLDWVSDSGFSSAKLVTVFHPPEAGRSPHATIGFAGFIGAIAGMSAAGITVTQSNLDNSLVTLDAAAWPFRLRYIMETAVTIADVRAIYRDGPLAATAGTANHLIGSQADARAGATAAVAAECIATENVLYADNDPQEANASAFYPPAGKVIPIGFPLPQALWRSNHALAASILPTQVPLWNDTLMRYDMMRQFILDLEPEGALMDAAYARQMAATMGQKGADYYSCASVSGGSNVISAVYDPASLTVYAAWEDGSGASWLPAACTVYQQIDLSGWF